MMTCIGGPRDTLSLYSVQVHESAHMWFPMQVGSDETPLRLAGRGAHALQSSAGDAGVLQGLRPRAHRRATPTSVSRAADEEVRAHASRRSSIRGNAAYSVAIVRQDGDEHGRASRAAWRRRVPVGVPDVRAALAYKHPTPYDFFNTFNDAERPAICRGSGARGGTRPGRSIRRSRGGRRAPTSCRSRSRIAGWRRCPFGLR